MTGSSKNYPDWNFSKEDFIETAQVKSGTVFITRKAGTAPGSANKGTGIEVVTEVGGTTNNVITNIRI